MEYSGTTAVENISISGRVVKITFQGHEFLERFSSVEKAEQFFNDTEIGDVFNVTIFHDGKGNPTGINIGDKLR